MIETIPVTTSTPTINDARELAPSELAPCVFLRQTEIEGQFVEIVMPPFELNDILEECERSFPMYAVQVFEVLAQSHPDALLNATNLSPELVQGLRNTQILGTVLTRHQVRGERALDVMPELQQAFGLAMKGRLHLTADPVPEI